MSDMTLLPTSGMGGEAGAAGLGGVGGMLSIMTTGDLNAKQRELAERLAVKVIAFLGITETAK